MTTSAYAPNPIAVTVGGTVTWTNNDSATHTSTGNGGYLGFRCDSARRNLQQDVLVRRHVPVPLHDSSGHGRNSHRPMSGAQQNGRVATDVLCCSVVAVTARRPLRHRLPVQST